MLLLVVLTSKRDWVRIFSLSKRSGMRSFGKPLTDSSFLKPFFRRTCLYIAFCMRRLSEKCLPLNMMQGICSCVSSLPLGVNHVTTLAFRSSRWIACLEQGDMACVQGTPALATSMVLMSMRRMLNE